MLMKYTYKSLLSAVLPAVVEKHRINKYANQTQLKIYRRSGITQLKDKRPIKI